MKKHILLIIICLLSLSGACHNSQNNDDKFIQQFYDKYIWGYNEFTPNGKAMCSAKMLNYLSSQFDYDCPDGECYAIWLFRSGHQDGPSNISKITNITPLGNNTYKVEYIDMGIQGTITIELATMNNKRVIDKIINNEVK